MKYLIDPHTHTLASGHAYSTIREMALAAAEKGIEILGITDHGPTMPGSCSKSYFVNFRAINRSSYGIRLIMGVEANIIDMRGNLDLPEELLDKMDLIIASLHPPTVRPGSVSENTQAVLSAMDRYAVSILGHPDDGNFPLDYETVVLAAREKHVLIELNNGSLMPDSFRQNGRENSRTILEFCRKHRAEIILSSDAHMDCEVGGFAMAEALLREVGFPAELVVNDKKERFETYLASTKRNR
jgi:putative hydrolase